MSNEKLIEEAAKAIWEESTNPGSRTNWEDEPEYVVDEFANQAHAAFAVFEKAHAPTNDERELNIKKLANLLLESVAAQGMRIVPASPEPQGEPSDLAAHVEQVAYADDSYGTEDLPENYERHYCDGDGEDWPCAAIRGAQGEPTDAQVEAAFQSILETANDVTTRDDVRSALRAAGEVKR